MIQIRATKRRATEEGIAEIGTTEIGTIEIRATKIHSFKVSIAQINAREVSIGKIRRAIMVSLSPPVPLIDPLFQHTKMLLVRHLLASFSLVLGNGPCQPLLNKFSTSMQYRRLTQTQQ